MGHKDDHEPASQSLIRIEEHVASEGEVALKRSSTIGTWVFKLRNYARHWCRVLVYTSILVLLMVLIAIVLGTVALPHDIELDATPLLYGLWLLYDLVPLSNADAVLAAYGDSLILFRILGFAITAIVAGIIVAICLRPVHVLRLSKHGVIDLKMEELQFRFWVMAGYRGCLYDVSAELIIATNESYGRPTSRLQWPFRYSAPRDHSDKSDSHSVVHGVWTFSIPLNAKGNENHGSELHSFFSCADSKDTSGRNPNYHCVVRIKGSSKDGRIYYCEKKYALEDIFTGGTFAPLNVKEESRSSRFNEGMNYHNFNVVCMQQLDESDNRYDLRPTKLFDDWVCP